MSQKIKNFKNSNFTPLKLREFKSENFTIQSNKILNRHSFSFSCLNNLNKVGSKNSLLTKNPTENYLYDKINLNNLSKVKSLLDKSINNLSNSTNQMSAYNSLNYNSSSLEHIKISNFRKGKFHNHFIDNFIKNKNETFYSYDRHKNIIPLKYPKLLNNKISAKNQFYDRYKENIKNTSPNTLTIYIENKVGKNDKYKKKHKYKDKNNNLIKDYNLLDKIVLIQSFWRSYFLRKLIVGGLEKYYSAIAVGKYLEKIINRNKKNLFKIFIDSLKIHFSNKKTKLFSYIKSKNDIKRYIKNNEDNNGSFGIPKDKVKDCIYFFIKKEQIKAKNNKYNNNKKQMLNITDYNWNNNKKFKKHNVKIVSLYDKKNNNKIKKENSNKNFNAKMNLFNKKDNYYNKRCSINNNNNSNYPKNFHKIRKKTKKLTEEKPKKIYVRKKVRENSTHNISNYFSNEISSIVLKENNIETPKDNNYKLLYSLLFTIRRKYLNLFYPFLIGQLIKLKQNNLLNKISIIRKRKNNSPGSNLLQKKIDNNFSKVKSKPKTIYKSPKIKVNKNNKIEKNRKLKTLKKIIEKKSNKIDKMNAISLTKYFLIWNNYNFFKKVSSPSVHVHLSENFKKLEHKKPFIKDTRSQNATPKKHIKIRFKKTVSSPGTIGHNSCDRKHISSLSTKKMIIIKKYSCFNNDLLIHNLSSCNNITCKKNLLNQINKKENKFFNKIVSVIQKLELKNILFKHFHQWKKESKK